MHKPYTNGSISRGMEEENTIEDAEFGEVPERVLTDAMIEALEE